MVAPRFHFCGDWVKRTKEVLWLKICWQRKGGSDEGQTVLDKNRSHIDNVKAY